MAKARAKASRPVAAWCCWVLSAQIARVCRFAPPACGYKRLRR
jgi:hypothetical protein